jgi:cardiolipin synthase
MPHRTSTTRNLNSVSPSDTAVGASTDETPEGVFDRLWTIPNAFTLLRLLCLPLFLWLLFSQENRAGAAWLLAGLGSTDWVDGYIARRFDQGSEFGKIFDPTVDRLFFFVAVIAIIIDGSIPIWFAVAVLVREVLVGGVIAFSTLFLKMQRFGVTWLGKCATFLLMGAVPSFLIGSTGVWEAPFFSVLAWLFGIPGLVLSYWTGIAYIPLIRAGLATGRASTSTGTPDS